VGTVGLTLFTFGISLLLLGSFVFGVFVGKNIESYPHKIASMPTAITQKIVKKDFGTAAADIEKKDDFSFTFYDTLSQNKEKLISKSPIEEDKKTKKILSVKKEPVKRMEETTGLTNTTSGKYFIQVASFRDRARTEKVRSKLSALGYSSIVEEKKIPDRGIWYRISIYGFDTLGAAQESSKKIEGTLKGVKCLIRRE
jgi:cell division septation protein DedD